MENPFRIRLKIIENREHLLNRTCLETRRWLVRIPVTAKSMTESYDLKKEKSPCWVVANPGARAPTLMHLVPGTAFPPRTTKVL